MSLYNDPHQDQALLSQYLDGDLKPDQSTALEEHLKHCVACQREIKMLRQTINWIGQLRQIDAPKDFSQKVNQRIRKQRAKRRRLSFSTPSGFSWMPILLAAIAIAISIFLFFLGQQLSSSRQTHGTTAPSMRSSASPTKSQLQPRPTRVVPPTSPASPSKTATPSRNTPPRNAPPARP